MIKLWDTRTFQCVDTLSGHDKGISCITKIPGTSMIASGSFDSNINIWRIEGLDHGDEVWDIGEEEYDIADKAIVHEPNDWVEIPSTIACTIPVLSQKVD